MQKLGKYEILEELGHGAMGVVYKARDPFIGRLIALKTINSNLVDRPDLLERFYQEAQSAGKLQHPNIVTVFELGQEKDTPFIAMEYLDGDSLEKTIVRQTELPLALKVGYVVRICQALEYAHKNRVVHRDIKPGNIMVNSDGAVKVVDFGIARLVDFSRTHTNMMIGTPAYMAPELFRKKKADERTDIWAVGVTFYELICYQRPFTGDGYDIIRTIMEDEFPPISSIIPDCSPEIESIIQRMLRKQPTERYQRMEDVLLDLEPVWNQLRINAAISLAERAREFYEMGDLQTAYDTVRRARQVDPSNALVKNLLEKISAEIRRLEILPIVQEHLSRGKGFLQSGQFREAQAEAEAALALDSRHESAQKLIAEVEAAAARTHQLEQKLRVAKQRLAEGALIEAQSALRQAMDLDPSHPQALELKRQIEEEQGRRERRKQLTELLHRARSLCVDSKYDECLALTSEGLRIFPNEPELRSLHETAQADQAEEKKQLQISGVRKLLGQRKLADAREALEVLTREQPQDTIIRNLQSLLLQEEQEEKRKKRLVQELASLRSLVSAGKLREAVARGELLLKEFPQEYEVNDLVTYARGEVAQQEQKKNEQEREKQVRELLEAQRYREAGEAARRASQEFPRQEVFRSFAAEAEEKWKEQQEKEKIQREVQQRIQEIRSKIKRQELTDAIDMAQQTLATFGPDTDVTQLLHAAEVEADQRNRKLEERSQKLKDARGLVEKQNFAGATQLLENAIANRTLDRADPQTKMMLVEIAEREEAFRKEQQKRKKEEERKREERNKEEEKKRKEAQKQAKAAESQGPRPPSGEERPPAGREAGGPSPHLPPASAPPTMAPTVHQSATNIASAPSRPKPSVPVLTPLPVAQPVRPIQTQIRVEELTPTPPVVTPSPSLFRKPAVLATVGVAVVAISLVVYHFMPTKPTEPTGAFEEDRRLEAEAKQFWGEHKFEESLADWKRLADHSGPLRDEAAKQVDIIQKERADEDQLYSQGMSLLSVQKKCAEAAKVFNQIAQAGMWRAKDALQQFEVANKGCGGSLPPLWQALLVEGKQALDRKDYSTAQHDMQQVVNANGVPKEVAAEANSKLVEIRSKQEQKRIYDHARVLEQGDQKQQAIGEYQRVADWPAPNKDGDLVASANDAIKRLQLPKPPGDPYGSLVGDVRNLIKQGNWDAAQAKLRSLPKEQPEYPGLEHEISAGLEDREFETEQATLHKRENPIDLNGLKSSLTFFRRIASQPGRHSAEADTVAKQIDRMIINAGRVTEIIGQARTQIQSGQFSGAMKLLPQFGEAGGDANVLRQEITGAEDKWFQNLKNRHAAVDKKSLPDLTKLHSEVQQFQNNAVGNGSETAKLVDEITKEINALTPQPPVDDPRKAIRDTVEAYAKAMTARDLSQVRAVRKLSPSDEKEQADSFARLRDVKGYQMTLSGCTEPSSSGDAGKIACTAIQTSKDGIINFKVATSYSLQRINGRWWIVSSEKASR